ncbi:MAG: hypothetical protein LC753_00930 [Acidobacteria bacterium]|nr:hypothetical protein [Acidobacteriota bacterium]MCA1648878.1 hypothetical protein [Acidobacteriota bacterium]
MRSSTPAEAAAVDGVRPRAASLLTLERGTARLAPDSPRRDGALAFARSRVGPLLDGRLAALSLEGAPLNPPLEDPDDPPLLPPPDGLDSLPPPPLLGRDSPPPPAGPPSPPGFP